MTNSSSHTTGNGKTWQIGDLAKRTGLSVRTLHHYEEIGLLSPAERGENGYRLYDEANVGRLQQIVTLKQLGFSLEQIGECLNNPQFSPEKTIGMAMGFAEEQAKLNAELRERLDGMQRFLKHKGPVSAEEFLDVIALMQKIESAFTPEQMDEIRARGKKLGRDKIVEVENEWPKLIAAMTDHKNKGTDPTDPAVQKLAKRWQELVDMFTGGNPEIAKNLKNMYEKNPDAGKAFGGPDPELFGYVNRAMQGSR